MNQQSRITAAGFGDTQFTTRPAVPPITRGVCADFPSTADLSAYVQRNGRGELLVADEYARYGNQTVARVAIELLYNELHGEFPTPKKYDAFLQSRILAEQYRAELVSDGMTAVICALQGVLFRHPDPLKRHHAIDNPAHIVIGKEGYKQIRNFCDDILRPAGVQITPIETSSYQSVERVIQKNTRLIFIELPTNPFLRIPDLAHTVSTARTHNIPVILDATIATPMNLPLVKLGCVPDVVVHSATKYLNGHNDTQAGYIWGKKELMVPIGIQKGRCGGQLSPDAAYALHRGLRTFHLRMKAHNARALSVANALANDPTIAKAIEQVWYPLEASHPDYERAKTLLTGGGGVITFTIKTPDPQYTAQDTDFFVDTLTHFLHCASFGGTSGMVQRVLPISYDSMPPEQRAALGITHNLIRMSIGTETSAKQYVSDIRQALRLLAQRIKSRTQAAKSP